MRKGLSAFVIWYSTPFMDIPNSFAISLFDLFWNRLIIKTRRVCSGKVANVSVIICLISSEKISLGSQACSVEIRISNSRCLKLFIE